MLRSTSLLVIYFLTCQISKSFAQLGKTNEAPDQVVQSFNDQHFPLEVVTWEWDKKRLNYIAHFYDGSKEYTAYFDTFGKWLNTKRVIRESDLPKEIKFNMETSSFKNWDIKSIEEVQNKDDGLVYIMEITPNKGKLYRSKHTKFLTFLPNGLLLNLERLM